ncbi:hypothetical protein BE11_39270 [Sorangium cellulosum]|nr:hypothetical protein BE11_39270 [Sorangium cellulosum]
MSIQRSVTAAISISAIGFIGCASGPAESVEELDDATVGEEIAEAGQALCAHSQCDAGGALAPSCDPCAASVCAVDAFCCTVAWDSACVQKVGSVCGQSCANVGDLGFDGCHGEASGCTSIGATNPIASASAVAVSPDGSSVYATSGGSSAGAVAHFRRQASGELVYGGCIGQGVSGCTSILPARPLYAPRAVVSLQDSVYTLSAGGSVAHFRRSTNGDLAYAGCIGGPSSSQCTQVSGVAIQDTTSLAASADGKSVYAVATTGRGAVYRFDRVTNGDLTYAGCIGDGVAGCASLIGATNELRNPRGVTVTANGSSVYTISTDPGAIAHFRRDSSGALTYAGCIGRSSPWQALTGCTTLAAPNPIYRATALGASPDSTSVYVGAAGTITHFRRSASGDIAYAGCIGSSNGQCTSLAPSAALSDPSGVAVTADSKSVYVASRGGTIAHFKRATSGDLLFAGCIGQGVAGCTEIAPTQGLGFATGVAVSSDARSVYVSAGGSAGGWPSGVVSRFDRLSL